MSEKTQSPAVSALRSVLGRSKAVTDALDLKQGNVWEYTGFDKYALALQAEYQKLVVLRTDIRANLATVPDDLAGPFAVALGSLVETFGTVEAKMLELESVQVINSPNARRAHQALVTAQIVIAAPLKGQIAKAVLDATGEANTARTARAAKTLRDDTDLINDLNPRMAACDKLDIGTAVVEGASSLRGNLGSWGRVVLDQNKPLSATQRGILAGFGEIEKKFKAAALAEVERKRLQGETDLRLAQEAEAAEAERKRQLKVLSDWAAALKAARAEIANWKDDGEIDEARLILHPSQPFTKNALALDRKIKDFPEFEAGKPQHDQLQAALDALAVAGNLLRIPARAAIASRAADVTAAVLAVTNATTVGAKARPVGTEPYEAALKAACAKIPGLIEEVRTLYRSANHTSAPQVKRRDDKQAQLQGEADKYERIGGWMNACGLTGGERTGLNGPVFMRGASSLINGYTAHVSQYLANAALPPDRRKSKLPDAMAALFGAPGPVTGPHITVERVDDYGSPDNARLFFRSARFLPGNIPFDEQADYQAKMRAQLNHAMNSFQTALSNILA